jgi:hypothetical protein
MSQQVKHGVVVNAKMQATLHQRGLDASVRLTSVLGTCRVALEVCKERTSFDVAISTSTFLLEAGGRHST